MARTFLRTAINQTEESGPAYVAKSQGGVQSESPPAKSLTKST
jgi:hypothetical protein